MEAILWGFVEQLKATRMLAELGLPGDEEWKGRVNSDTAYYLGNEYAGLGGQTSVTIEKFSDN